MLKRFGYGRTKKKKHELRIESATFFVCRERLLIYGGKHDIFILCQALPTCPCFHDSSYVHKKQNKNQKQSNSNFFHQAIVGSNKRES